MNLCPSASARVVARESGAVSSVDSRFRPEDQSVVFWESRWYICLPRGKAAAVHTYTYIYIYGLLIGIAIVVNLEIPRRASPDHDEPCPSDPFRSISQRIRVFWKGLRRASATGRDPRSIQRWGIWDYDPIDLSRPVLMLLFSFSAKT